MDEEDLLVPLREESAEAYVKDFEETKVVSEPAKIHAEFDEPTAEAPVEKTAPEEVPRRITPIILKAINDGGDKNKNSSYIVKSPNPNYTEPVVKQAKKKGRPRKYFDQPPKLLKYGKRGRPSREAIERARQQQMQECNEVKDSEDGKGEIKTEGASQLTENLVDTGAGQIGESKVGIRRMLRNQLNKPEEIAAALIDRDFKENTMVKIADQNSSDASTRDRVRKCPQRFAQDYVYARKTRGRPKLKTFCSVKEFCDFKETKPSYVEEGIHPKPTNNLSVENHIGNIKRKPGRPRIHPPKEKIEKRGRGRPSTKPFKVKREPEYDENGLPVKRPRGRPSTNPFRIKREPKYDENGVIIKQPRGRPRTRPLKEKREPRYDENGVQMKLGRGRPFKIKPEPPYDVNGLPMKRPRGRPSTNPYKIKREPLYDENGLPVKRPRGRPSTNPFKTKAKREPQYDENGVLVKPPRGRPSNNPFKVKREPRYDENGMIMKQVRGRPRIHPKRDPDLPKRGRGRPPKYQMGRDMESGAESTLEADDLCDSSILEPQVNIIEGISSYPNNHGIKLNGSGCERNRSILDAMHLRKIDRLPCATMESFIAASLNATTNSAVNISSKTNIQIVNDEPVQIEDSDSESEEDRAIESPSNMGESTAERRSTDLESFSALNQDSSQVTVVIDADNGDIIATKPRTNALHTQNETVSTQTDQVREDSLTLQNDNSPRRDTEVESEEGVTIVGSSPPKLPSNQSIAIQVVPEIYEIPDEDSRSSNGEEDEPVEIEEDSSEDEDDSGDEDDNGNEQNEAE